VWILVVLISGILFLGYAKVGSRTDQHLTAARAPAFMLPHAPPAEAVPEADGPRAGRPAGHARGTPARHSAPDVPAGAARHRPWWEH
jgi:hypothetical protein